MRAGGCPRELATHCGPLSVVDHRRAARRVLASQRVAPETAHGSRLEVEASARNRSQGLAAHHKWGGQGLLPTKSLARRCNSDRMVRTAHPTKTVTRERRGASGNGCERRAAGVVCSSDSGRVRRAHHLIGQGPSRRGRGPPVTAGQAAPRWRAALNSEMNPSTTSGSRVAAGQAASRIPAPERHDGGSETARSEREVSRPVTTAT